MVPHAQSLVEVQDRESTLVSLPAMHSAIVKEQDESDCDAAPVPQQQAEVNALLGNHDGPIH